MYLPLASSARRRLPLLDDPPLAHDGHAIREGPRDRDIVRDHEIGKAALLLDIGKKVQDLAADRDIGARERLVGDDQAWLHGERAGDREALALPAAQLMRVALEIAPARPQPDALKERDACGPARAGAPLPQCLAQQTRARSGAG